MYKTDKEKEEKCSDGENKWQGKECLQWMEVHKVDIKKEKQTQGQMFRSQVLHTKIYWKKQKLHKW